MVKSILFFTLFSWLFVVQSNGQSMDLCKIIDAESKRGMQKYNLKSAPQTAFYDVKYYQLELDINPSVKYLSGKVSIYFTARDSGLSQVVFDLSQQLTVDSVKHQSNSPSFSRLGGNTVEIPLSTPLNKGQLDSVTIYYRGIPVVNGGIASFSQAVNSNGDTVIWTLSEPYGAQEWWPCKNTLTDKADSVSIFIRTPKKHKVASIGLLMKIDTIGNDAIYHWKTNYPTAAYLVAIGIGNYEFYREKIPLGGDSLLMHHFLYQGEPLANSQHGMNDFLVFFDSLFGSYPFIKEKYGHASFTFGGGMEHQTMSFMGNYGGELKAHELIHQWFGNKITCGSWSDLWLNEGFATYFNTVTYEFDVVHDSYYYDASLNGLKAVSLNYPHGSVYREDTSNVFSLFNGQVYQKGAYSLHMIRWVIGDSAFFSGVKNYINDSNLVYGFATTEDLKWHFEQSSGQNLSEFFNDWIYGKGYPNYQTRWSQNGSNFSMTIDQAPSDSSVSFFDIPLPYKLVGQNWDTTIIVNPTFSGQQFNLPISTAVQSIQFDPDNWILAGTNLITSNSSITKSNNNRVRLLPNPSKNQVQVEIPSDLQFSTISIYSMDGQKVLSYKYRSTIDISSLSNGMYLLELRNEQTVVQKKLIKY